MKDDINKHIKKASSSKPKDKNISAAAVMLDLKDDPDIQDELLSSSVQDLDQEWTTKNFLTIILSMMLLISIVVRKLFERMLLLTL